MSVCAVMKVFYALVRIHWSVSTVLIANIRPSPQGRHTTHKLNQKYQAPTATTPLIDNGVWKVEGIAWA